MGMHLLLRFASGAKCSQMAHMLGQDSDSILRIALGAKCCHERLKQWLGYLILDTQLLPQNTVCLCTLWCCIRASGTATCLKSVQPSAL